MRHPWVVECPFCEFTGQPVAAHSRVGNKRSWVCESCGGIITGLPVPVMRKKPRVWED